MFRTVLQAFTSPAAGPVGFVLSIVMCGLLLGTVYMAERNDEALRGRIAQLTSQNQKDAVVLRAKLTACQQAPAPATGERSASLAALTPEQRAQRLASAEPQGFDVCARMESADRAVLETLK